MDISNKEELIVFFRDKSNGFLNEVTAETNDYKKQATKINKKIQGLRDVLLRKVLEKDLSKAEQLNHVLLISYVTNVVMLEYRNKVWNYDYMAFSRRIGEIWEPFCKLPFYYPVHSLKIYEPLKCKSQLKNGPQYQLKNGPVYFFFNQAIVSSNL